MGTAANAAMTEVIDNPIRRTRRNGPQAKLALALLGNFHAKVDGTPFRLVGRKARAILAYLALTKNQTETRDRLVGLFWSDSDEDRARASLRQATKEIKDACAESGFKEIHIEKQTLWLEAERVSTDLIDIQREAAAGRVHERLLATPRLADALLTDLEEVDASFRVWVLAKRQTLHDRLIADLERALPADSDNGRDARAIANAILNLDPTHEVACRYLMQALATRGDVGGALRVYKSLWDLLDSEYDVEPSHQTQALVVAIKREVGWSARPTEIHERSEPPPIRLAPAVVAPAHLQIFVRPFDATAVDMGRRPLVVGFRHELVASLARFREWRVADLGPPTQAEIVPEESGGPAYEIEATAIPEGDRALRMILTLREKATSIVIWSERFQASINSWFDIQQSIVRRIAAALNTRVSADRIARIASRPDVDLDAYDRWLRGHRLQQNWSAGDWERVTALHRDTIHRAPTFAAAYCSLVQMNNARHIMMAGVFRSHASEAETLGIARRAAEIDPTNSRTQLCLGWSLAMTGSYDLAELHVAIALELNDNDPWTLVSAALFHAFMGRSDEAVKFAGRALSIDVVPSASHWVYQSTVRFLAGDDAGCVEASVRANGAILSNMAWRAAALSGLGRRDEAAKTLSEFFAGARRAWSSQSEFNQVDCTRWLLHLYPISVERSWARLRDGLGLAGAPVSGLRHHDW